MAYLSEQSTVFCIRPGCPDARHHRDCIECPICNMLLVLEGGESQNRYEFIERRRGGGFSEAFVAQRVDGSSNRYFVKVFNPDSRNRERLEGNLDAMAVIRGRFNREPEILRRLEHRRIPELIDFFQKQPPTSANETQPAEPYQYIVQRYINGCNLEEEFRRREFSEQEVVELFKEVLKILRFLQQERIVHRDINPRNIIISSSGGVYLVDFGAAVEQSIGEVHQNSEFMTTTCSYAPRELLRSQGQTDNTTDLYSLAIVGIVLLTRNDPPLRFDQNNFSHEWDRWLEENLANVRNSNQILSPIINRMLSSDCRQRYQSAQDALQAVENACRNSSNTTIANPSTATTAAPPEQNGDGASSTDRQEDPSHSNNSFVVSRSANIRLGIIGFICLFIFSFLAVLGSNWKGNLDQQLIQHSSFGSQYLAYAEFDENGQNTNINLDRNAFTTKINADSSRKLKQDGITAFAESDYNKAIEQLTKVRELLPTDPETLIYLINAKIRRDADTARKKIPEFVYRVAVVLPLKSADTEDTFNASMGVLRGVAQKQLEVYEERRKVSPKIKLDRDIEILIVDELAGKAQETADKLVADSDIIAVIGHLSSSSMMSAFNEYTKGGLVFVSPTATTEQFSTECETSRRDKQSYCFRTVPSDRVTAKTIVEFLKKFHRQEDLLPIAIFYSNDDYGQSILDEFCNSFFDKQCDKVSEQEVILTNLSSIAGSSKELERELQEFKTAKSLMLFPTTDDVGKAREIIKLKPSKFVMMGSDTLYDPKLLLTAGEAAYRQDLIIAAPWHRMRNPNTVFLAQTQEIWEARVDWGAAMASDALAAIVKGLENVLEDKLRRKTTLLPTRSTLQQALVQRTFQVDSDEAATGQVQFNTENGNRLEQTTVLVKVVPSSCSKDWSYAFVLEQSPDNKDNKCSM